MLFVLILLLINSAFDQTSRWCISCSKTLYYRTWQIALSVSVLISFLYTFWLIVCISTNYCLKTLKLLIKSTFSVDPSAVNNFCLNCAMLIRLLGDLSLLLNSDYYSLLALISLCILFNYLLLFVLISSLKPWNYY